MPSNHLILWCPLLFLPSIFPSIRDFSNESILCIRWPKHWSFSFNISPSNEHPGLISFRMDWLDLLAVPGTLKSLLQHHGSKASILQCSAFFIVQLSHPYMTTGKTIALTRQTFVGKVMSLLLNMLSRLFITLLPRSKHLLISWLQSPSAVILEPQKIKSDTVSPSISHEVMGPDAMIFVFWMLSFKPTFHSPLSLLSRGFLVPLHWSPKYDPRPRIESEISRSCYHMICCQHHCITVGDVISENTWEYILSGGMSFSFLILWWISRVPLVAWESLNNHKGLWTCK